MNSANIYQAIQLAETGTVNGLLRDGVIREGYNRFWNIDIDVYRDRSRYSQEVFDFVYLLNSADRGYVRDGVSGNYLEDFLYAHGNDAYSSLLNRVTWHPGNAVFVGSGLVAA